MICRTSREFVIHIVVRKGGIDNNILAVFELKKTKRNITEIFMDITTIDCENL